MQMFLETERLLLRRFTEADADNLVALDADPEVMRLLTGGRPTPREVVEHELLPSLLQAYERFPSFGTWAALERATGEFVGWFALDPPDGGKGDEVELGYRLRKSAWGKGYATEGSRALVDKAFAELGVQRIYAETMAVNTASRRVLEKAGFRHVRTFHLTWDDPIEGTEHGEVEYELRTEDWETAEKAGNRR
jgi:RimJ/RimL family protein N-acetyltransferase